MYYDIIGLCPRTDIDTGQHGFHINLHPKWCGLVEASGIGQYQADHAIKEMGDSWLDACGYGQPFEHDGKVGRLYEARSSIRVSWGEWGPEHITVPGSACGLDIERRGIGNPFRGGASLLPHNIDHWGQVQLLLIVFTFFAESLVIQSWEKINSGEV
jgi:hypothetical protein